MIRSNQKAVVFVFASLSTLVGCVHAPDIEIRHPLTARTIDANQIVKGHDYAEQARGLPAGAMTDQASLLSLDERQACFGVSLHELDAIDLGQVAAKLSAPGFEPVETPQVWPEPAVYRTYDGLVPERHQTGYQTVCAAYINGVCTSWRTDPIYTTVYLRGPVRVYEVRGKLCFAHGGLITAATEQVTLELRMQKAGVERTAMGWGGAKKAVFRWGFVGAVKAGK